MLPGLPERELIEGITIKNGNRLFAFLMEDIMLTRISKNSSEAINFQASSSAIAERSLLSNIELKKCFDTIARKISTLPSSMREAVVSRAGRRTGLVAGVIVCGVAGVATFRRWFVRNENVNDKTCANSHGEQSISGENTESCSRLLGVKRGKSPEVSEHIIDMPTECLMPSDDSGNSNFRLLKTQYPEIVKILEKLNAEEWSSLTREDFDGVYGNHLKEACDKFATQVLKLIPKLLTTEEKKAIEENNVPEAIEILPRIKSRLKEKARELVGAWKPNSPRSKAEKAARIKN